MCRRLESDLKAEMNSKQIENELLLKDLATEELKEQMKREREE